ncbi:MAG: hypothetical protein OEV44_04285 [Spirochaetota bacterium]|nr:hypothetical protein [Spirochaetota bacterium]
MFSFFKSMRYFKVILVFAILLISIVIPYKSWACSVCGSNDGDVYLWFIFILMPLPLIMIGLIVWWVYRKNKSLIHKQDEN